MLSVKLPPRTTGGFVRSRSGQPDRPDRRRKISLKSVPGPDIPVGDRFVRGKQRSVPRALLRYEAQHARGADAFYSLVERKYVVELRGQ